MAEGTVRLGHFGLGIIGLGLLRSWRDPDAAQQRTGELGFLLGLIEDDGLSPEVVPQEHAVVDGYTRWAVHYDVQANGLIELEEPVVREVLGPPVGPGHVAVDAACGTGRVSRILADLGYEVHGIDATEAMLAHANGKVPSAVFEVGTLTALPVDDAVADVTTCTLALAHVEDLGAALAELARVTKPGGRVVLSDLHPYALLAGGSAAFPGDVGEFPFVVSFAHLISTQLRLFAEVGLEVERCEEPLADVILERIVPPPLLPAATAAFGGSPFALIWSLRKR